MRETIMPWFAWIAIAGIASYTILEIVKLRLNKDKTTKLEDRVIALENSLNGDVK
jgi:hypothetical protein